MYLKFTASYIQSAFHKWAVAREAGKEIPFILDAPDALEANDSVEGLCRTWLASGSSSGSGVVAICFGGGRGILPGFLQ
jgi:hypothetical protein